MLEIKLGKLSLFYGSTATATFPQVSSCSAASASSPKASSSLFGSWFAAQPEEEIDPGHSEADTPVRTPGELYETRKAQLQQDLDAVKCAKEAAITVEDFGKAAQMKARETELYDKLNSLEAQERARPRTAEEIRQAEEEKMKVEEERNARVKRKQELQEELEKSIAGKAAAIAQEDFAAAQAFKSREKECQAELEAIKEAERSASAQATGSKHSWSELQSFMLCSSSEWHKHAEKAWLVDNFETHSLRDVIDQLNRGVKACKAGFCTVYDRRMEVYYVLYDDKSQAKAHSHFPRLQNGILTSACI